MDNSIKRLAELISDSKRVVFFGGAGVSTESGIPDFRSDDGIFSAISKYGYPPEELLSIDFFNKKPDIFFKYYKDLLLSTDAKPNSAHIALEKLENKNKLTAVITQNIDGLHSQAGSKNVFELHGSIHRNYCCRCHGFFDASYIKNHPSIPYCPCGGMIKPDVVLYGESLDNETLSQSIKHVMRCDMLIIGGTSLQVYPAAGLIQYYNGNKLVLINKSETSLDDYANLTIHTSIGEVMSDVIRLLNY